MERAVALAFAALLSCAALPARADSGDFALGPLIGIGRGGDSDEGFAELRLELRADYGLFQYMSVRASGGVGLGVADDGIPEISNGFARGLTAAGVVFAYDVWTIVPELFLYGGGGFGSVNGWRAGGLAALRMYFSRTTSVTLSGGWERDWGLELGTWLVGLGVWL